MFGVYAFFTLGLPAASHWSCFNCIQKVFKLNSARLPQIKTGWLIFSTASDIIIPGWKYSPGLKASIAPICWQLPGC
jgi:hypothetical protein